MPSSEWPHTTRIHAGKAGKESGFYQQPPSPLDQADSKINSENIIRYVILTCASLASHHDSQQ